MDKGNLINEKQHKSIKETKEKVKEDFDKKKTKIAEVAEDMLYFKEIYDKER